MTPSVPAHAIAACDGCVHALTWQSCYTACCPLACDFSGLRTFTFTQDRYARTIYPRCALL